MRLLLILLFSISAYADLIPRLQIQEFRRDLEVNNFTAIAQRTDQMLDLSLHMACKQMIDSGDAQDAYEVCDYYDSVYKNFLTHAYGPGMHDIGSHPEEELIAWISTAYKKIEAVLGVDLLGYESNTGIAIHIERSWISRIFDVACGVSREISHSVPG